MEKITKVTEMITKEVESYNPEDEIKAIENFFKERKGKEVYVAYLEEYNEKDILMIKDLSQLKDIPKNVIFLKEKELDEVDFSILKYNLKNNKTLGGQK